MIKKVRNIFILAIIAIAPTVVMAVDVSAATGAPQIDKAYLEQLYNCYRQQNLETGYGSIKVHHISQMAVAGTSYGVPAHDSQSCGDLIKYFFPNQDNSEAEKLGYETVRINESRETIQFKLEDGGATNKLSITNLDSDGKITKDSRYELDGSGVFFVEGDKVKYSTINMSYTVDSGGSMIESHQLPDLEVGKSWLDMADVIRKNMRGKDLSRSLHSSSMIDPSAGNPYDQLVAQRVRIDPQTAFEEGSARANSQAVNSQYFLKGASGKSGVELSNVFLQAGNGMLSSLGYSGYGGLAYSEAERIALYRYYLEDFYEIEFHSMVGDVPVGTASPTESGYIAVKFSPGFTKSSETHYVKIGAHIGDKVYGINDSTMHFDSNIELGYIELLEFFGGLDYDQDIQDEVDRLRNEFQSSAPEEEIAPIDACMNSGGAMGWLICPAIYAIKDVASDFYDNVIEPMLAVNTRIFSVNTGDGAYAAWAIFRDFANIAFVILLLIVIFSQVTGFGIDNYGIKKMLPKLIITAILVNLSYIICSFAIDISNILGSGLKELFVSLNVGSEIGARAETHSFMEYTISRLITIGIGGGTVLVIAKIAGPGIIVSILIALLGMLISIFFMLVALGARMVGVVLLVAIAPVALVLYALPNTSKIFDKWFTAFKAILLVYPICGALIGGGQFAARLILSIVNNSTDEISFFYVVIACLASVLPFFMVPSLLKNSMAALGNIGAKISGIGAKIGGGLQNAAGSAMRNTNLYKSADAAASNRRDRSYRRFSDKRADKVIDNYNKRVAQGKHISASQNDAAIAAQQTKLSNAKASLAEGRSFDAAMAGIKDAEKEAAIKDSMALYAEGNSVDVEGNKIDPNNNDALMNAMVNEGAAGNITNMMALKRMLDAKGKSGMDKVGQAFDNSRLRGNKDAIKELATSISGDATYKTQARSLHSAAKNFAESNGGPTLASAIRDSGGAVSDMKYSEIGQMTDAEFDSLLKQANNANAVKLAQDALADQRVLGQLNTVQINRLNDLANGIMPSPSRDGYIDIRDLPTNPDGSVTVRLNGGQKSSGNFNRS